MLLPVILLLVQRHLAETLETPRRSARKPVGRLSTLSHAAFFPIHMHLPLKPRPSHHATLLPPLHPYRLTHAIPHETAHASAAHPPSPRLRILPTHLQRCPHVLALIEHLLHLCGRNRGHASVAPCVQPLHAGARDERWVALAPAQAVKGGGDAREGKEVGERVPHCRCTCAGGEKGGRRV
eukprot:364232-Chlamydomonas_euryale.AAC.13